MSVITASGTRTGHSRKQYLGKYRGVVLDNADPMGIGRIKAQVIGVFTQASTWALPCFPVAGQQLGMIAIPPSGAGVWIEFEHGDPDYPIWTGCYYSTRTEVPPMVQKISPSVPAMTMQTPLKNSIQLSDDSPTDSSGGIVLQSASGAKVIVNDSGIYIDNGKGATIKLVDKKVSINGNALEIQ